MLHVAFLLSIILPLATSQNYSLLISTQYHILRFSFASKQLTVAAGNGSASSFDGPTALQSSINTPAKMAYDSAGCVIIAELGGFKIRKLCGSLMTTIAGSGDQTSQDGPGTQASFVGL